MSEDNSTVTHAPTPSSGDVDGSDQPRPLLSSPPTPARVPPWLEPAPPGQQPPSGPPDGAALDPDSGRDISVDATSRAEHREDEGEA
jgi:hypothetical protein